MGRRLFYTMRIRSRNVGIMPVTRIRSTYANKNLVFNTPRSEYFARSSSTIEDEISKVNDGRERTCKHVWSSDTEGPYGLVQYEGSFHWNTNDLHISLRDYYSSEISYSRTFTRPTLADVPTYERNEAIRRLIPSMNDGLSLLNSLIELKDLRRMFSIKTLRFSQYLNAFFMTQPGAGGKKIPLPSYTGPRLTKYGIRRYNVKDDRLKPAPNRTIREKLADIAQATIGQRRYAANDFLNWNFGWKPFISDLTGIYRALLNFDTRLKYIEANAGKVLRRHVSVKTDIVTLRPTTVLSTNSLLPFWGGGDGEWGSQETVISSRFVYQPRYHATLVYSYTLPKVAEWRRKLRGYLDIFGVRLDPYILWETIPFSFVVDWFLDVGGFLRSFTPRDLGMEVSVVDFSESLKYHIVAEARARVRFRSPVSLKLTDVTLPLHTAEYSYYERKKGIPSFHAIAAGDPGLMQTALGAALVLSRSRIRKHRTRRR